MSLFPLLASTQPLYLDSRLYSLNTKLFTLCLYKILIGKGKIIFYVTDVSNLLYSEEWSYINCEV